MSVSFVEKYSIGIYSFDYIMFGGTIRTVFTDVRAHGTKWKKNLKKKLTTFLFRLDETTRVTIWDRRPYYSHGLPYSYILRILWNYNIGADIFCLSKL